MIIFKIQIYVYTWGHYPPPPPTPKIALIASKIHNVKFSNSELIAPKKYTRINDELLIMFFRE